MKAESVYYAFFLTGKKQFNVPLYQRRYRWNEEKAQIFWDDLINLSESKDSQHFMGTMVMKEEGIRSDVSVFTVVDGQQRLVTLFLLLAAIKSKAAEMIAANQSLKEPVKQYERALTPDDPKLSTLLGNGYYLNQGKNLDPSLRERFTPTTYDRVSYQHVLAGRLKEADGRTKLREVAEFFNEQLKKHLGALDDDEARITWLCRLLSALDRLQIVRCSLEETLDDPNQVFESINSKGQPLSAIDLIRNYSLMAFQDQAQRSHCYESCWKPMETQLTGVINAVEPPTSLFGDFMRAYLALQSGSAIPTSQVYAKFKSRFSNRGGDYLQRMTEIASYAQVCRGIMVPKTAANPEGKTYLSNKIFCQSLLRFSTPLPLLLKFHGYEKETKPSDDELANVLFLLERYFVRRALLNRGVRDLGKFFAAVSYKYERDKVPNAQFNGWLTTILRAEKFEYVVGGDTKKIDVPRAPTDADLDRELPTARVYEHNSNVTRYVLSMLNLRNSATDQGYQRDTIKISDLIKSDVEHFLPQEPRLWMADLKAWHPNLTDDQLQAEISQATHVLGNLLVTETNDLLSNDPLAEKVKILEKSRLPMNGPFVEKYRHKFTFDDIRARSVSLKDQIKLYWPQV